MDSSKYSAVLIYLQSFFLHSLLAVYIRKIHLALQVVGNWPELKGLEAIYTHKIILY